MAWSYTFSRSGWHSNSGSLFPLHLGVCWALGIQHRRHFPLLTPLTCKKQTQGNGGENGSRSLPPRAPSSSPLLSLAPALSFLPWDGDDSNPPCPLPSPIPHSPHPLSTWTGNQRTWCPIQGPRDLETIPGDVCHICGSDCEARRGEPISWCGDGLGHGLGPGPGPGMELGGDGRWGGILNGDLARILIWGRGSQRICKKAHWMVGQMMDRWKDKWYSKWNCGGKWMATHEPRFPFAFYFNKEIAWHCLGQRWGKGKKEGKKEGDKEAERYFQAIYVIGNALACYSSPIHMCPSWRIIPWLSYTILSALHSPVPVAYCFASYLSLIHCRYVLSSLDMGSTGARNLNLPPF